MTGIATVSEGEALNWYGGGKTELTTNSNLGVTYGVKTEVVVGFKSDFSLATQTDIFVGSKFDASLAIEMSLKKNAEITSAVDGEFYCMDTYVGTVGASAAQLAAVKTLRTASFILLASQTAAMLLATATATASKVMKPDSTEEITVPWTDFKLGYLTSIATIAATIAPALMMVYSKLKDIGENNNPSGVLSMDADGGVFLGARSATPVLPLPIPQGRYARLVPPPPSVPIPQHPTSGVLVNSSSVKISSSSTDLGYNRQNGSSVLGFKKNPGKNNVRGSSLEVRGDGSTAIHGTRLSAELSSNDGASVVEMKAQAHKLIVTSTTPDIEIGPALLLTPGAGVLKYDIENNVTINDTGVNAVAGGVAGSVLRLTKDNASMGAAGNNITINKAGVALTFGQSKIQINAAGISFGNVLSIMNPSAPGVSFAGLQQALLDVQKLNLETQALALQDKINSAKIDALARAEILTSETLVRTRNRLKKLAARAYLKK